MMQTCFPHKLAVTLISQKLLFRSCVSSAELPFPAACEISSHYRSMYRSMLLQESLTWHASLPFQSWQSLRKRHAQVYEGSGRSMLLTSCRAEAKLWDVGACRGRAEALWAPNETISESLHTFEGVRNAIFRQDGLLVTSSLTSASLRIPHMASLNVDRDELPILCSHSDSPCRDMYEIPC